jgi:rare lipoprotein A
MNTNQINSIRCHLIQGLLALVLSSLLAACSSSNIKPVVGRADSTATTAKPAVTAKRGGYYLDDGPGDHPPANIDAIPDAVPHAETLLDRANRPYVALGKSYTPISEYKPYNARGVASWYGKRYHGQKTSSGEVYDMYAMTGAHTTLPLPSYAKVTNPANGRSVIVRINDRGPFHSDRLIDLSYAAAYKLRLQNTGSGIVEVEAINSDSHAGTAREAPAAVAAVTGAPVTVSTTTQGAIPAPPSVFSPAPDITKGTYVQVGVFKLKENAERLREKLIQQSLAENTVAESWYNDGVYRVRLGSYSTRQDAEKAAAKIRQSLGTSAIVINQP